MSESAPREPASAGSGAAEARLRAARPRAGAGLSPAALLAGLAGLWLIVSAAVLLLAGADSALGRLLAGLALVLLPALGLGLAALGARQLARLQDELLRLGAGLPSGAAPAARPAIERRLDEIARAQKQTEDALASFTSSRSAAAPSAPSLPPHMAQPRPAAPPAAQRPVMPQQPPQPRPARPQAARVPAPATPAPASAPPSGAGEQPSLGLEQQPEAEPLPLEVLIRALHFPEGPEDAEGFRALRQALSYREAAQIIQSSQDVLTLLSQEGIYMDDLTPDRAHPDLWRRFARGARGRATAALGGIHDREALARAAARMRADAIFRDAAHHFLRKFDQLLSGFEQVASDAELAALADTRTARAFMLLGRVAGTFD